MLRDSINKSPPVTRNKLYTSIGLEMRIATALLLICLASAATAKVGTINLQDLTKQSSLIVVGTVSSVHTGNIRMATFEVERFVKGTGPKHLEFVAEPTWTCDISDAKPGERLLLFLDRAEAGRIVGGKIGLNKKLDHDAYLIGHSGRGRIQLLGLGANQFISFKPGSFMEPTEYVINLRLPKDLPYRHEQGMTILSADTLLAQVDQYCHSSPKAKHNA